MPTFTSHLWNGNWIVTKYFIWKLDTTFHCELWIVDIYRLFHGWWARAIFILKLCKTNERVQRVSLFYTTSEYKSYKRINREITLFIIYIPRFISEQNSKKNISLFSFKEKQRAVKPPHSSRVALKWLPCKILYTQLSSKNAIKRQN